MGQKRFHEQNGSLFIAIGQTLARNHAVYTQVFSLEIAGELEENLYVLSN